MNFVKYNAIINMLSRPPATEPEESYLHKKGYGEVPQYLKKIKEQIRSEYEFIASLRQKRIVSRFQSQGLAKKSQRSQKLKH